MGCRRPEEARCEKREWVPGGAEEKVGSERRLGKRIVGNGGIKGKERQEEKEV